MGERERERVTRLGQARPVVTWLCSPQSLWAGNDNTASLASSSTPGSQTGVANLSEYWFIIFKTKALLYTLLLFQLKRSTNLNIFWTKFLLENVCPCLLNCELALVCWLRAASLLCAAASSGSGPRSEQRSSSYTQLSSSARHLAMGGTVCQPEDH